MKKTSSLFILVFAVCFSAIAQPTTFNYQAVVRNTDGSLLINQEIQLRIKLVDDAQINYYVEIHNIQTNTFGQVSVEIGGGTPIEGNFSSIPWSTHQLFLKTSISMDQGATYTELGQTPLLSVPYALFAASGNQGPPGNGIDHVESIGDTAFILHFTDGSSYTTPTLAGNEGTGIDYVENYNDTALIFHFTDGSSFTTNSLIGPQGQDGTGISSTVDNGDGTITFFYSDGSSFTTSDMSSAIAPGENMQTLRHDGTTWVATDALKTNGENVAIGTNPAISRLLVHGDTNASEDDPIFEVKNKNGNVVFAVYQTGVEVNVDETAGSKSLKGGFAVGGLTGGKDSIVQYFKVTPDSVRVYLREDTTKAQKGGFAVGGLTWGKNKTIGNEYLHVSQDSVRIYIDESGTKAQKGGFAVGGLTWGKNKTPGNEYLRVSPDSVRIYIDKSDGKAQKGGFAVGGLTWGKKENMSNEYLRVSPDSVRIYIDDSETKAQKGGFAVGGLTWGKTGQKSYLNVEVDTAQTILPAVNRILWYPTKNAFLTGNVLIEDPDSVGTNSMATGFESKAIGKYSQAMGYKTIARGDYSTAIGDSAIATGASSLSFGDGVITTGDNSFALGYNSQSVGQNSVAAGNASITYGDNSVAMGYSNSSAGAGSATFGFDNSANGDYALATGRASSAGGNNSVAIGYSNISSATGSTSFGYDNNAYGAYSFAAGRQSTASGDNSVAIGYSNYSSKPGSASFGFNNDATGNYALAAGYSNVSSGTGSASFGYDNSVSGAYSVAIGRQTSVSGYYSLAIGYLSSSQANYSYTMGQNNEARHAYSFAFGKDCIANEELAFAFGASASSSGEGAYAFGAGANAAGSKSYAFGEASYTGGYGSYAFGSNAKSYGTSSYAIGNAAKAYGNYNFAIGHDVLTGSSGWQYATVLGKFNSTSVTNPLLVVGNGTSNTARSNALVLNTNGNLGLGVTNPAQRLDINGNIRLTGGDRTIEVISGYLDIRPHDNSHGIVLRDHTGITTIWSALRTVPSTTDFLHISMNSTNLSEGLIISDNGNIGIEISTPGEKLDVAGDIRVQLGGDVVFGDNNTRLYEYNDDLNITADDDIFIRPDDDIYIASGDNTSYWVRFDNGNRRLGIGTTSPGYYFHVQEYQSDGYIAQFRNTSTYKPHGIAVVVGDYTDAVAFVGCKTGTEHLGGLYANTSGDLYLSGASDARVKNSIEDTRIEALDIINKLKVRDYFFNKRPAEKKTTGFIAQEVMEILPDMVIYDNEKDLYLVARDFLVPYITRAVQEQQEEIKNLKSENEQLKQKINEIMEKLLEY
ncbi:putative outer membrane protein [Salinivirga cyanobacteriivorans]|uniref:Putative outer membrane protein n=1 Tax=Salinivirga cyanobacteriivorans TaxID=1307839 RepID=A0A0S2HWB9_9BACT|nr:tail fiber domain-containing protein [Salinivirga cyanobacteriivorans]ALO14314.1 putative outer membrane protein [Salinivirga cyanobacteriivorans]